MARRTGVATPVCAEPDCTERGRFAWSGLDELRRMNERWAKDPYLCLRHHVHRNRPDQLVTAERAVQVRLTCAPDTRPGKRGKVWCTEDGKPLTDCASGPGLLFDGFSAFAEDFPLGTVLTVTAYALTPEAAALEQAEAALDSPDRDPENRTCVGCGVDVRTGQDHQPGCRVAIDVHPTTTREVREGFSCTGCGHPFHLEELYTGREVLCMGCAATQAAAS